MKPLSLPMPHVIVMVGIPGSGKSYFAERFADTFSAPYFSYDRLRAELFNQPSYNAIEQSIIKRVQLYEIGEILKSKHTIVIEGGTDARTDRHEIARLATKAGYKTLFVWVQTDTATAKQRALKSVNGTIGMPPDHFEGSVKRFTAPNTLEHTVVISGKHTYASQLRIVLKRLASPHTESVQQQSPPERKPPTGRQIAVR